MSVGVVDDDDVIKASLSSEGTIKMRPRMYGAARQVSVPANSRQLSTTPNP